MYISIISFGISFLALAALIGHKLIEMRRGAPLISQKVLDKTDALVEGTLYAKKEELLDRIAHSLARGYVTVRKAIRAIYFLAVHSLHARLSKILERMKRSGVKKNKGSVSFFLKHISEKDEVKTEIRDTY